MSKEPEFRSYTDDALADLKAYQDAENKRKDLEIKKKYELKSNSQAFRQRMFKDVGVPVITVFTVLAVIAFVVFGIAWLVPDNQGKSVNEVDAAWNESCRGSGGTLVLNDISTNDDNACTFSNGLYSNQHGYALTMPYDQMVPMCKEINGTPTKYDKGENFQYCVMPNGFAIEITEP